MLTPQEIATRLWNRLTRVQHRVQRKLIQKADQLGLCLLTIDMMVVLREKEKFAIANILNRGTQLPGQFSDFALLYLDLPETGLPAGFYKLKIDLNINGPQALLVSENNVPVGLARYFAVDVFASIVGSKSVPKQKLPIFETFNKSNDTYVLGGVHADGQPFAITLEL